MQIGEADQRPSALGKTAGDALRKIREMIDAPFSVVYAPHPAARHAEAIPELLAAERELIRLIRPVNIEDLDA